MGGYPDDFDKQEELIALVRQRPFLYNRNVPMFRDLYAKQRAWKQIARKVNISAEKCQVKWNSLKSNFFRVAKKRKQYELDKKLGCPPFYRYFDQLSFLLKRTDRGRKLEDNHEIKEEEPSDDQDDTKEELSDTEMYESLDLDEADFTHEEEIDQLSFTEDVKPTSPVNGPTEPESYPNRSNTTSTVCQEDDAISAFFKSASDLTRSGHFNAIQLIELKVDILKVIKHKMEAKNNI